VTGNGGALSKNDYMKYDYTDQLGTKWYAVYTKPCFEKRVAELLDKQNIENYCPLQKTERRWSDRKKIISEPVFKSYVFVRIGGKELYKVKDTSGVLDFVNFMKKPAIIPDNEIETVKKFLSGYKNVQLEKMQIAEKDSVQIISGPLMNMNGTVLNVKHRTVTIMLPSLGIALTADVDKENIVRLAG
jgi:transcription antitermination factor NusG